KKGKRGKKGKAKTKEKTKAAVTLPSDEQISPAAKNAANGPAIPYPVVQPQAPAVQVVAPASPPEPQKPALSAAERAAMSEGLPLARDRRIAKPKVLDT